MHSSVAWDTIVLQQGYSVHRKGGLEGKGCGVLLYVKDTVKCTQVTWLKEIIVIQPTEWCQSQ